MGMYIYMLESKPIEEVLEQIKEFGYNVETENPPELDDPSLRYYLDGNKEVERTVEEIKEYHDELMRDYCESYEVTDHESDWFTMQPNEGMVDGFDVGHGGAALERIGAAMNWKLMNEIEYRELMERQIQKGQMIN